MTISDYPKFIELLPRGFYTAFQAARKDLGVESREEARLYQLAIGAGIVKRTLDSKLRNHIGWRSREDAFQNCQTQRTITPAEATRWLEDTLEGERIYFGGSIQDLNKRNITDILGKITEYCYQESLAEFSQGEFNLAYISIAKRVIVDNLLRFEREFDEVIKHAREGHSYLEDLMNKLKGIPVIQPNPTRHLDMAKESSFDDPRLNASLAEGSMLNIIECYPGKVNYLRFLEESKDSAPSGIIVPGRQTRGRRRTDRSGHNAAISNLLQFYRPKK